jgi:hypothetical protein
VWREITLLAELDVRSGEPQAAPSRVCTLSPVEAALRGRIGAYVTHSRHDPSELTAEARTAFLNQFECAVDPTGSLPPHERSRRAQAARSAYFARLAYQRWRAARDGGEEATTAEVRR